MTLRKFAIPQPDLTGGVIWKNLLLFAVPILLSSLLQQLFAAADLLIVARFCGDTALAAVGSTTTLTSMMIGLFLGLSAGAGVVLARYWGAKDGPQISRTVHTALIVALAGGLLLTAVGMPLAPWSMRLMKTPPDVLPQASSYLVVIFAGMVPNLLCNMTGSLLQASGDSRRPLYYLLAAISLNLLLDLLFVGVFRWGVEGAAAATVIGESVAGGLGLLRLFRTDGDMKVTLRGLRVTPSILRQIIAIGVPSGLQSVALFFSNVLVQASINSFGSVVMAAWSVYNKLDNFSYMPLAAIGLAVTTFVSQNLGAASPDRAKKGVRTAVVMAVLIALFTGWGIILGCGKLIASLFTDTQEVIDATFHIALFLAPLYSLYGLIEIFSGAVRGSGHALVAMTVSLTGLCGVRIVYILLVNALTDALDPLLLVYYCTWVLTVTAYLLYYRRGKILYDPA